jgi:hypothetical protein
MQSQPGTTTPTPVHAVQGPPDPRFSYLDINVTSLAGLAQHLVVNNNIPLLTAHPNLRILIRPAVERAVQECIHPVVDWSMKIALTTCEQIIKKDFSLDADDTRMRAAAHHMVRSLSAGMCFVVCWFFLDVVELNYKFIYIAFRYGIDSLSRSLTFDHCEQSQDSIFCCLAEEHQSSTERIG